VCRTGTNPQKKGRVVGESGYHEGKTRMGQECVAKKGERTPKKSTGDKENPRGAMFSPGVQKRGKHAGGSGQPRGGKRKSRNENSVEPTAQTRRLLASREKNATSEKPERMPSPITGGKDRSKIGLDVHNKKEEHKKPPTDKVKIVDIYGGSRATTIF